MADFPTPVPTQDTEPFWNGLSEGKFLLQQCPRCGTFRYPPKPMCPQCNSLESQWVPASGKGEIYSYTVTQQALHPSLVDRIPHVVILVELDEGVRMTSNIVQCELDQIQIGMPVEVVFEKMNEGVTLPKFKPIRTG